MLRLIEFQFRTSVASTAQLQLETRRARRRATPPPPQKKNEEEVTRTPTTGKWLTFPHCYSVESISMKYVCWIECVGCVKKSVCRTNARILCRNRDIFTYTPIQYREKAMHTHTTHTYLYQCVTNFIYLILCVCVTVDASKSLFSWKHSFICKLRTFFFS